MLLITGAKILHQKMLHHIVHDGLHDTFFNPSRKVETFPEVYIHAAEDFRLRLHVGIILHRAVQVIAVTEEISMDHRSEGLEYLAVRYSVAHGIHQHILTANGIDQPYHVDSSPLVLTQIDSLDNNKFLKCQQAI